ncbi:MAG: hypothetical protein ACR5LD_01050 [Symbiopectobacterium sp.]
MFEFSATYCKELYDNISTTSPSLVGEGLRRAATIQLSAFDSKAFMLEFYRSLPFNNIAYRQLVSLL